MTFEINEEQAPMQAPEQPKGLYKFVIQLGLAKDAAGARMVLIIVALCAIVLAVAYPFLFK